MTLTRARSYLVAAALLWSLSGAFAKLIALPGPVMAAYRVLFAGIFCAALLRRSAVRFHPAMLAMVACFAIMNLTFVTAMTLTSAANAIFLQYTASIWMFVASVLWLGEKLERRNLVAVVIGLTGIAIILAGGRPDEAMGIGLALLAGVTYGGVAVLLRVLRGHDSVWLTVLNHLGGGLLLVPVVLLWGGWDALRVPLPQLLALAAFGIVQMALPYLLFSRALTVVTPQEAGILTLLEPVFNPLIAYLAVGEVPADSTLVGGAVILGAVAARYARFPGRSKRSAVSGEHPRQ